MGDLARSQEFALAYHLRGSLKQVLGLKKEAEDDLADAARLDAMFGEG